MAFGQQSGPPASSKQVQYLESLLKKAGYSGFRDARGPLGLTQRQGNGKFTSREASDLISQLLDEDGDGEADASAGASTGASTAAAPADSPRPTRATSPLAGFKADILAEELERRGWTVTPPD